MHNAITTTYGSTGSANRIDSDSMSAALDNLLTSPSRIDPKIWTTVGATKGHFLIREVFVNEVMRWIPYLDLDAVINECQAWMLVKNYKGSPAAILKKFILNAAALGEQKKIEPKKSTEKVCLDFGKRALFPEDIQALIDTSNTNIHSAKVAVIKRLQTGGLHPLVNMIKSYFVYGNDLDFAIIDRGLVCMRAYIIAGCTLNDEIYTRLSDLIHQFKDPDPRLLEIKELVNQGYDNARDQVQINIAITEAIAKHEFDKLTRKVQEKLDDEADKRGYVFIPAQAKIEYVDPAIIVGEVVECDSVMVDAEAAVVDSQSSISEADFEEVQIVTEAIKAPPATQADEVPNMAIGEAIALQEAEWRARKAQGSLTGHVDTEEAIDVPEAVVTDSQADICPIVSEPVESAVVDAVVADLPQQEAKISKSSTTGHELTAAEMIRWQDKQHGIARMDRGLGLSELFQHISQNGISIRAFREDIEPRIAYGQKLSISAPAMGDAEQSLLLAYMMIAGYQDQKEMVIELGSVDRNLVKEEKIIVNGKPQPNCALHLPTCFVQTGMSHVLEMLDFHDSKPNREAIKIMHKRLCATIIEIEDLATGEFFMTNLISGTVGKGHGAIGFRLNHVLTKVLMTTGTEGGGGYTKVDIKERRGLPRGPARLLYTYLRTTNKDNIGMDAAMVHIYGAPLALSKNADKKEKNKIRQEVSRRIKTMTMAVNFIYDLPSFKGRSRTQLLKKYSELAVEIPSESEM